MNPNVRTVYRAVALALAIGLAGGQAGAEKKRGAEPVPAPEPASSPVPKIGVTIPPLAYLVDRLTGGKVEAIILMKEGGSPTEPSTAGEVGADLANCKRILTLGLPFEKAYLPELMANTSIPVERCDKGLSVLSGNSTTTPLPNSTISSDQSVNYNDPCLWLSVRNLRIITDNIQTILTTIPDITAPDILTNYQRLINELDSLDRDLQVKTSLYLGREVYVQTPFLRYFLEDYGLVEMLTGPEGSSTTMFGSQSAPMEGAAQEYPVCFVPSAASSQSADLLAMGNRSVVAIDPFAYDVIANINRIAAEIARANE